MRFLKNIFIICLSLLPTYLESSTQFEPVPVIYAVGKEENLNKLFDQIKHNFGNTTILKHVLKTKDELSNQLKTYKTDQPVIVLYDWSLEVDRKHIDIERQKRALTGKFLESFKNVVFNDKGGKILEKLYEQTNNPILIVFTPKANKEDILLDLREVNKILKSIFSFEYEKIVAYLPVWYDENLNLDEALKDKKVQESIESIKELLSKKNQK